MSSMIATAEIQTGPVRNMIVPRSVFSMTTEDLSRLKMLSEMMATTQLAYSKINSKQAQASDLFLVMLKGIEIGLDPMASIDLISIIGGKPALGPQGMLALIYRSGLVEDIKFEDDGLAATVTVKRRGMSSAHIERFSMADAERYMTQEWSDGQKKTIPLSQKANWKSQPAVMRMWRCISAMCRKLFPDIIQGLMTPEELDPDAMFDENGQVLKPTNVQPMKPAQEQPVAQQPSEPTTWANPERVAQVVSIVRTQTGDEALTVDEVAWMLGIADPADYSAAGWGQFDTGRNAANAALAAHDARAASFTPGEADDPLFGEGDIVVSSVRYIRQGKSSYLLFPDDGSARFKTADGKPKQIRAYGRSSTFKAMLGDAAYALYGFDRFDNPQNQVEALTLAPSLQLRIEEKGSYWNVTGVQIVHTDDVPF